MFVSFLAFLWDCLCPSLTGLHVEASSLLCWTHTLCLTSHTCETTILMEFTTEVTSLCVYIYVYVLYIFIQACLWHTTCVIPSLLFVSLPLYRHHLQSVQEDDNTMYMYNNIIVRAISPDPNVHIKTLCTGSHDHHMTFTAPPPFACIGRDYLHIFMYMYMHVIESRTQ